MINLNKIVIVGGGSAGWMSAASMIRAFPDKEVVVIESPDYPTIGVGESTIGSITGWANWLGIDEKDFMPETDATYKMSIKFNDFYKKDSGGFHYPFGTPFLQNTTYGLNDWYVKKAKFPDLKVEDYARTFYPALTLAEQNKISLNESGRLGNFNFKRDVAYHFDATKFGLWLKNKYCLPRGVKIIQQTVESINTNDDGIESLMLTDGSLVTSDLFIDCTGFKSMLLEGALNEPWDDFSHILPNNSAWAARVPYTDKEKEMQPFTNCTAIENGWVWNTPTWERIGTGYVFSDKYVSKEKALEEFKNYLRSDKMAIHDKDRDVESYTYRFLKFRVGIHKRTFVKNVVAIGLSAGFIEPLESNGLYTVHEFLDKLILTLSRGSVTQWDIDGYNAMTRKQYLEFKDFVAQHYALSNRSDTKYWQDITKKEYDVELINLNPSSAIGFNSMAETHFNNKKYSMYSGTHCIATGLNYIPLIDQDIQKHKHYTGVDMYKEAEKTWQSWKVFRKLWQDEADQSHTMYSWLKENMYKNH